MEKQEQYQNMKDELEELKELLAAQNGGGGR